MFTLPWVYMVYGSEGDRPANAMYRVLILEYKQAYDSLLSN